MSLGRHASPNVIGANPFQQQMLKARKELEKNEINKFLANKELALENLQSNEVDLNFIEIDTNNNFIKIEEVYLERIVKYNTFQIIKDIKNLYEPFEKTRLGFYVKTSHFNELISKENSYESAKHIFGLMRKAGVKPNAETFSVLINKAENYDQAFEWYRTSVDTHNFSVSVFGEILKQSLDNTTAFIHLEEFFQHSENIEEISENSVNWIFNCFCSVKRTNLNFNEILLLFEKYDILLSSGVCVHLIEKASSLAECYEILEKFKDTNIPIDSGIIQHLISKANSLAKGYEILEEFKDANIPLDSGIINHLIQRASSLDEGYGVLEKFKDANIPLDTGIIQQLIGKAGSLDEGYQVLEKFKDANIPVDTGIIHQLIRKAGSLNQSYGVLEKFKDANTPLDSGTIERLIGKTVSLAEASEIIELLVTNENFNLVYLVSGLNKSNNLSDSFRFSEKYNLVSHFPILDLINNNVTESFEVCIKKIREIFNLNTYKSIKIFVVNDMLSKMAKNNLIQTLERKDQILLLIEELKIVIYDDVKDSLEMIQ